ncbi:MAG: hypothetical protein Q9181_001445 [Wetmoreana brouardii]
MRISSVVITVIWTCAQHLIAMPVADTNASPTSDVHRTPPGGDDGLHTWHPPRPGWAFAPGAYCGYDATPGFRNPEGRDKAECARLCRCETDRGGLKERDEEAIAARQG